MSFHVKRLGAAAFALSLALGAGSAVAQNAPAKPAAPAPAPAAPAQPAAGGQPAQPAPPNMVTFSALLSSAARVSTSFSEGRKRGATRLMLALGLR